MFFSVVIPVHKHRKQKLATCLASVFAQNSTEFMFEVIIVDDASGDDFSDLQKLYNFKLLKNYSLEGPARSRNKGISCAVGKYIVFVDSDCVVPNDWLATYYRELNGHGLPQGIGSSVMNPHSGLFNEYDNYVYASYPLPSDGLNSTKLHELPFALGNICYAKDALISVGLLNSNIQAFSSGEDADLKQEMLERGFRIIYCDNKIVHDHELNLSNFCRQALSRGAGMLYDSMKNNKLQSKASIYIKIILSPIYFLYAFYKFRNDFKLIIPDTLFFVFRNIGKLYYYDAVVRKSS